MPVMRLQIFVVSVGFSFLSIFLLIDKTKNGLFCTHSILLAQIKLFNFLGSIAFYKISLISPLLLFGILTADYWDVPQFRNQ
jgi:hypothetical protein